MAGTWKITIAGVINNVWTAQVQDHSEGHVLRQKESKWDASIWLPLVYVTLMLVM